MQSKDTCKLSCCYSCTLCNRAIAKERQKRSNKVCERCSLCKSLSFCPCCHKCPQCCQKSTCGRPSAKVLAGLALSGFKSKGSVHTKARVFPALQSTTPPIQVTCDSKWLCKSSKKRTAQRSLTGSNSKTGISKGSSSNIPGFLQPVISGTKAQQQMEAHSRPKSPEFVPSASLLQDGNPRDHQTLPLTRGVGHFAGLQRRLLSCSTKSKVAEILTIPSQQSDISIHHSSFWLVNGSVGVHQGHQGSQVDGSGAGYSNPPVPR